MSKIPSAVLSDHFQSLMQGKRLLSAVFTTFRFEPQFFETQILPAFLDIPLSHSDPIKLVQLEDALRALPGSISVYYDQHGLVAEGGPAKLDIRRIPVRHKAIFHPKNVLVLVEDAEPNEQGKRNRTLLCACASANLTRAGWWENVEIAHVEQIREGGGDGLRDDLRSYLNALLRIARAGRSAETDSQSHEAINAIREFLSSVEQARSRSAQGRLRTRMHFGTSSLVSFLGNVALRELKGLNLEVVSPYFDDTNHSKVLDELIELFEPAAIRVMLPRDQNGAALCSKELHHWVKGHAVWGALTGDLVKLGSSHRAVHAKVYRFFEPKRGGREFIYAGSSNLTSQGCLQGGNWESGFLVECTQAGKPDWWLQEDAQVPREFCQRGEEDSVAASGGSRLDVRFDWTDRSGSVRWTGERASPTLSVRHKGIEVFGVTDLVPNEWHSLTDEQEQQLEQVLRSTSMLEVDGESSEPGLVLVQEDGMASRPSLLLDLSTADILKAWSLLSQEQRSEFISLRATIADTTDDPLLARLRPAKAEPSLFDRFAGIFHAFGCLEKRVRVALAEGREREANYLVFGEKYDSLGSLVRRVIEEAEKTDEMRAEHYVVMLSAKQFLDELARDVPEYWKKGRDRAERLTTQLGSAKHLRDGLAMEPGMLEFLDWFDRKFLARAQLQEVAND